MNIQKLRTDLEGADARKIIMRCVAETRGVALASSFGADSAVMLHLVSRLIPNMPVIMIDTGYLFPETYRYAIELAARLKLNLKVYAALTTPQEFEASYGKLWESDKNAYHQMRKLEPLERALRELKVTMLLSGIRKEQTEIRSYKDLFEAKPGTAIRVHPILDWTRAQVDQYLDDHRLPRHPLVAQGYESIGDTHSTIPGTGRSGRLLGENMECGFHTGFEDGGGI